MRFWDALFLIFVFFPLVTGGFWLRREGMHLELTQAGPGAAVLALWLWIACRRDPAAWQRSFVCRGLVSAFGFWRSQVDARPVRTLSLGAIFFGALWFSAAWARHHAFRTGAIDLGIFTNAFWNLAQTGRPFAALKTGTSLLSDHQSFIIYPITAIYALYPGPGILLALQSFGLAAGGAALFLLGRQRLPRESLLLPLLPFVYWLYFPTRSANLFDFHPEVFMLPLALFAAWGLQETRWRARAIGLLCFVGVLAAKESGGPVAAGLGVAWLLGAGPSESRRFTRAFGPVAILFGVAAFHFDTKIVPALFGVKYGYGDVFAPFGTSLSALALAPFQHPVEFFSRLFGPSRLKFLAKTLLPFAFLPLAAPVSLIAALPGLLMLFLGQGDQRLALGFHYSIEPSIGYFLAFVAALSLPAVRAREKLLLFLLPVLLLLTYGRSEAFHWRFHELTPHQRWVRNEVLPAVHPTATLGATSSIVPHLSTRHWSHFIPVLPDETGALVECVLWERSLNNSPMLAAEEVQLQRTLDERYQLEFHCGPLTMHRRAGFAGPCLTRALTCPEGM